MRKKKSAPRDVQFKRIAIDTKSIVESKESGEAEFDAYASVFGNIDSFGDVLHKGAFARSLKEWAAKGAPIPLYYNHSVFGNDPTDNIGFLKVAQEDDMGLKVTPVLDVEANTKSSYVHHLLKSGRVRELSIGYIPKTYDYSEVDGVEVRNLRDVDLLEVSVVPVAANDKATVVEVRSALMYGAGDDAKADDADADADEQTDDSEGDAEALTSEAVEKLAEAVTAAGEQLAATLDAFAEALNSALGTDDDSGEDEAADTDSTSETAGAKNGKLSARTRAALAMMALHGADKEIAQ